MATTTVATAQDLIDALAAYGSGDTIYVADGTYNLSATLEKTSGGIPSIRAANRHQAILQFGKAYSWTADGAEYWCSPDKAGGTHTAYEKPWCVYSVTNGLYRQAQSGWRPYDYSSEPLGNQFDVGATFPTPDDTSEFELRCAVPHDILGFLGSVSGSVVTVTNILGEAQATAFDWQDQANWQVLARGYMVMGRQADMRPGTWRWDVATARLYIMPFPGEDLDDIRVPQDVRRGIRLEGADSWTLGGFQIWGVNGEPHWGPVSFSDCGAVYAQDCEDAVLDDLVIRYCAGAGIRMKKLTSPEAQGACDAAQVSRCDIRHVGGQGIVVGGVESSITSNTVVNSGFRTLGAPAITAEHVTSIIIAGNSTNRCSGGSLHVAANHASESEQVILNDHSSLDDMTNQIGDRGCVYFIGRFRYDELPANVSSRNLSIQRRTTNGSGDHGVYLDEGSYGTFNNCRIKGFGSQLGWYDASDQTLGADEYSGRTMFWNNPQGPTAFNGGALIGDIVTIDVRTSSEPVTLNGVAVMTRRGTLTNGTVDRLGSPGVIDPP